ncbi:c-type cytochrome biogenesis protein CcsB [bacterium]|nr:c-type cytochrome biogenesis protein CcsB [bacterium]
MISGNILVNAAVVFYTVGFAITLFQIVSRLDKPAIWSRACIWLGWSIHSLAFIFRWIQTYKLGYGHVPVTNRYESLIFFGWCLALAWLVVQRWIKEAGIAAGMQIIAAAMTASAGLVPNADVEISPLMPALKSNWLLFHVVTCFLAYAAFAVATFVAMKFLVSRKSKTEDSSFDVVSENLMYRCISVGFFLLTLGILSGSAWAQQSWGRYWGWDPKEVWSLITWIVYAIFLHARLKRNWGGTKLALLAIAGFLAVMFTFLGVNYLPALQGLHSYA